MMHGQNHIKSEDNI